MKKIAYFLLLPVLLFAIMQCSDKDRIEDDLDQLEALSEQDSVRVATPATRVFSDSGKYVYLTIDDAPVNGCSYIDSVIAAEKIDADIFVVGNVIDGSGRFRKYYDSLKRNPFLELYNHSYSHANGRYADYYKNPQNVFADFEKMRLDFDISHKIARLPGRNLWMMDSVRKKNCTQSGTSSAQLLVDGGYKVFGWDVEWKYSPKDYSAKETPAQIVELIEEARLTKTSFTHNHVVLLTHNQMFAKEGKREILVELIRSLRENGYTFVHLSEYPTAAPVKDSDR